MPSVDYPIIDNNNITDNNTEYMKPSTADSSTPVTNRASLSRESLQPIRESHREIFSFSQSPSIWLLYSIHTNINIV